MNKIAVIMVGLPALGKSTAVARLLTVIPDAFVYSTDDFIERIAARKGTTYNDEWAANIKGAQEYMDCRLCEAIKFGKHVIFDQTNLSAKKRKSIIARMKQDGYRIHGYVFAMPKTALVERVWKDRLASRVGKTIPENVLKSMISSYVEPTFDEGYDEMFVQHVPVPL